MVFVPTYSNLQRGYQVDYGEPIMISFKKSDSESADSGGNMDSSRDWQPALLPKGILWYLRPSLDQNFDKAEVMSIERGM